MVGEVACWTCINPEFLFWVTDGLQTYRNPCIVLLRYVEWVLWQLIKGLEACPALLPYPTKHALEAYLWFEQPHCRMN
jgi:hypothetical protein